MTVVASEAPISRSSARNRRRAPSRRDRALDRFAYRFWGPAVRSLQLEGYVWLVSMMLVVSNMQGVYRESFGTREDCVFLVLTGLWLGKHILLRWVVSWDPSTTQSPTIRGLIAHVTTSHLMGGQIYDRPQPRQISKFLGLKDDTVPLLQSGQSSLHYAARLWSRGVGKYTRQVLGWFQQPEDPHDVTQQSVAKPLGVIDRQPQSKFGRLLADTQRRWRIVRRNLPSVQFLLFCCGVLALKTLVRQRLSGFYGKETTSTYLYSASLGVAMKHETNMMKRKGDYQPRNLADSWWEDAWCTPVLVFMALTMYIFARVVPPIPDLVAGSHPMKDLRNDRTDTHSNSVSASSSSSGTNSLGILSRLQDWLGFVSPTERGWSEAQNPISTSPRIDVHTSFFFLRMVDVFWVVLFLPRCDAVCQLTGHCVSAWDWAERTFYLYPVGIAGPERSDRPYHFFPNQVGDGVSLLFISFDLCTLVPMLLWTQSLLANRTYWSTWGVCASEWMLHERPVGRDINDIPVWDARRKYEKNDIVLYNNKLFKATVLQPKGRPYYGFHRRMQNILAKDIGDPATSGIIYRLAGLQLLNFFFHFLFWYNFQLHWIRCDGLFMSFLANTLVTYVLSTVGRVHPSTSLAKLNSEVIRS